MKTITTLLADLGRASAHTHDAWRDQLLQFGASLGYRHGLLAIFASHDAQIEFSGAYLQTNFAADYLRTYDREKFGEIDPLALHCMVRSTPLMWSSETFVEDRQKALYAQMCNHGMRSGVAMPYHGPCGEFGILCFAAGRDCSIESRLEAFRNIPDLACFRDIAMDVFSGFMRRGAAVTRQNIEITSRELECLKWCAMGKSSWDIAHLMNCTEATVNYHFANIRRKFGASSRRMAVIKAIQLGFLSV